MLEITLVRAPEGASATELSIGGRSPFAGAKVADLSPRLAQRLGLRAETKGVAMVDIAPTSPAAGFGFQPRDIVREVNGEEITTAEKLQAGRREQTALVAVHGRARRPADPPGAALLMADLFEADRPEKPAARRGRLPTGCGRRRSPRSSARST